MRYVGSRLQSPREDADFMKQSLHHAVYKQTPAENCSQRQSPTFGTRLASPGSQRTSMLFDAKFSAFATAVIAACALGVQGCMYNTVTLPQRLRSNMS